MSRTGYILLGVICGLWFFTACIEPLDIEIEDSGQFLVVEGMITDEDRDYQISLVWSNLTDATEFAPVTGATVSLETSGGQILSLNESVPGIFETSGIRGQVGESYQLHITLNDGREYESDPVLLKRVPEIDSVYARFESRATAEGEIEGMQILLDTNDPENSTRFYRWTWDETWRYSVPFPAYFEYLGQLNTRPKNANQTCWQSNISTSISVGSSLQNTTDIIAEQALTFVSAADHRLQSRYSLLVKQYALDELEFLFWNSLKESATGAGTLFDRQPASIVGNVRNIADSGEPVLGYFSASAVSTKRIYVNRSEVFAFADQQYIDDCFATIDTIPLEPGYDNEVFDAIDKGLVFYDYYREVVAISGFLMVTEGCSDCTVRGGTTEKPDFWID